MKAIKQFIVMIREDRRAGQRSPGTTMQLASRFKRPDVLAKIRAFGGSLG